MERAESIIYLKSDSKGRITCPKIKRRKTKKVKFLLGFTSYLIPYFPPFFTANQEMENMFNAVPYPLLPLNKLTKQYRVLVKRKRLKPKNDSNHRLET